MAKQRSVRCFCRNTWRERILFMVLGAGLFQFFIIIFFHVINANIEQSPETVEDYYQDDAAVQVPSIPPKLEQTKPETTKRSRSLGKNISNNKTQTRSKTILLWNTFFQQESFGLGGFGRGPFTRGRCPVSSCQVTNNKSLAESADAIVVHAGYGIKPKSTEVLPQRSRKDQIFVFFEFEPPLLLRFSIKNMNDVFNLTFTYRNHRDTDIYSPYGTVYTMKKRNQTMRPLPMEVLKAKKKQVAWMVSDCSPPSKRNAYATALSKYINVDVYGKCGNLSCPSNTDGCRLLLEKNYKFYLAFENSFCEDYITEKTFKMMRNHYIIPVVLGGANYSHHVPPHSVIDVRDFKSPRHLANYLLELDKDDAKFMKYFEWKANSHIDIAPRIKGFCMLCEILHKKSYPFKKGFNIENYWNPKKSCIRGPDEAKAIHLYG